MPYPFHPRSPGTIVPETESEASNQDDTSNYHPAIFPTSESSLGLDEDGVGRQRTGAEVRLDRIGATPERLINVSERLRQLENNHRTQHSNEGSGDVQVMDISETGPNVGHETNIPDEKEDTPTLDIVVELMKELRKCIKELRVMYQAMQENHEVQKKEEAIRLTVYNDVLRSLTTPDY